MTQPETTETPALTTRRSTRSGLPPLRLYLAEAWRYRTFALYWSKADVKARNFDTAFGRVWHVLNPLLFGLIYFVLVGIIGGGFGDIGRLVFIIGNLYVWLFFQASIATGVGAVQSAAGGMLAHTSIPRIVLPFASTLSATNLFLRSLIAYVPLHLVASRGLHIEMLWLPYLTLLTALCGFGFALVLAVLNVYFRDISRLLPHVLRLWLYMSPVVWEYTRVLDNGSFARLNPMYPAMTAWTIALGGTMDPAGPGLLSQLALFTLWTAVVLLGGFFFFVSREDEFAIRN